MNERLSFFLGPGGLVASIFFGFKLLCGIEVFRFAAKTLQHRPLPSLPTDWSYSRLACLDDLECLTATTVTQIASQTGAKPEQLFRRGCTIHILQCREAVVAQLNIETRSICNLNDPKLDLRLADGDCFLCFLYTWPEFRRRSAAQLLIKATERDLKIQGKNRLITHVRATNVPSIQVFRRIGYNFRASVLSRTSGAFVGSVGMRSLRLRLD